MGLKNRQRVFVEEYLRCWNASEAARRAGYSVHTARHQGARLLANANIKAAIQTRMAALTMSADEVLARLADQARGTMQDFIDPRSETINLAQAEAADKLHLIKKFTRSDGEKSVHVSIELYDAQAALVQIGRHHALFTDKTEVSIAPLVILDDSDDGPPEG